MSHESNHVGPVQLSHGTARGHFLRNGQVVSFRTSDRTTGETWWHETRGDTKEGDVVVEKLCEAEAWHGDFQLFRWLNHSGFESVEQWVDAIHEMHGEVSEGYLYRIRAVEEACEKCGAQGYITSDPFCIDCNIREARADHTMLATSSSPVGDSDSTGASLATQLTDGGHNE
jgi:hypothetical protein